MKYFVSSDIHGFYTEWITALKNSGFDMDNPEHKIIVCGDLFDRGVETKKLQGFIMQLLKNGKIILIRGNHEDQAVELIENFHKYIKNIKNTHHYTNGTFQTMLDLTGISFNEATKSIEKFKEKAYETDYFKHIIPTMLNYYETKNYVFVHSWVPLVGDYMGFNENWRNASNIEWEKARWLDPVEAYRLKYYLKDKKLVFGHYHCSAFWAYKYPDRYSNFGENACFEPFATDEIIAIDSRVIISKKINVVVIDD